MAAQCQQLTGFADENRSHALLMISFSTRRRYSRRPAINVAAAVCRRRRVIKADAAGGCGTGVSPHTATGLAAAS